MTDFPPSAAASQSAALWPNFDGLLEMVHVAHDSDGRGQ